MSTMRQVPIRSWPEDVAEVRLIGRKEATAGQAEESGVLQIRLKKMPRGAKGSRKTYSGRGAEERVRGSLRRQLDKVTTPPKPGRCYRDGQCEARI